MAKLALALLLTSLLSSVGRAYVIKLDSRDGKTRTYNVARSNLTAEEFLSNPKPVDFHSDIRKKDDLEDRDVPCVSKDTYWYEINGDGDPHQNYKITEVANTKISCPGGVTQGVEHSVGFSWGFDLGPAAEDVEFGSVGFAVEESVSQSVQQSFSCATTPGNDMTDICVLTYTAVTAVTVNFKHTVSCGPTSNTGDLGTGTVYLPNANNVGMTFARGVNFAGRNIMQCRGGADREIDFFCGPAGGPEWFGEGNDDAGPWSEAYQAALEPAGCVMPIEAQHYTDI